MLSLVVVLGVAGVAGVTGILVGLWLRGVSAKQRNEELTRDLSAARSELAQAKAESAARAGFEALAMERERTIERISAERDSARAELQAGAATARTQAARISELEALLAAEQKKTEEKIALLETAKEALANQFKALAAGILDEKSKAFSEGSQKEIGNLLDPLKTQIGEFRKKVEEAQSDSKTGVAELRGLIGILAEQSKQMSEKTENLTMALKGSAKAQGDWGEFILRDLLEKAGLREGEQYSFQQSFAGIESEDGGRGKSARTDVIVYLPGGRNLVIDSKVSLTAYSDFVNAADEIGRSAALKLHLASVRGHISGLNKAGYDRLPGLETPDFVVMFVPIEPAFLVALQNDAALWADAYQQGILLVGPTTLLYIIRIVNVLWQQEVQARSVRDVMDRGAELYDKFVNFVSDLEAVGRSLRVADQNYSSAMKKLSEGRGNLVRQVEMLKQLGIRTGKSLPQNLLDAASVEEPGLALAASADEGDGAEN